MGPLLAVPPFPGARCALLGEPGGEGRDGDEGSALTNGDAAALLSALAQHRVGGCYWGRQITGPADLPATLDADNWPDDVDPWPLLDAASKVCLAPDDPRAVLALAAGKPLELQGSNGALPGDEPAVLVQQHLAGWRWRNPFSGDLMSPLEAIELCGFWRVLIDGNRSIGAAIGFAHWKQPTVAPLLWNGRETRFTRAVPMLTAGEQIAIWRSRLTPVQAAAIEGRSVLEVEDGFIRSAGLGADCVPPLSIIVDKRGIHFDPGQPSDLEHLLQHAEFGDDWLERAAALRRAIIAGGISKYERGGQQEIARPGGDQWHILVPGQVEDDRAVTSGGALSSNLELLKRARQHAGPDAFIIYKPHPDVLAGHRRGMLSRRDTAAFTDIVETDAPMASLIAMVDELHVNSSLAGFEALMHGKKVTVHGCPFYAGWGLTTDLGEIPARRTARRSIDELVAAAYLVYPRYLDPETGLPCPPETLVARLSQGQPRLDPKARSLVAVRQLAGRFNRWFARKP